MKIALNPQFETMFLLMETPWDDSKRQEVISGLNALGIDGAAFHQRNYPVAERYYAAFQKHKKDSPGAQFLTEVDEFLLSVYTLIFSQFPQWFEGINDAADEEVYAAVAQALKDDEADFIDNKDDEADFIDNMEKRGLSDRSKWLAMVLLQKPKQQLSMVASAVQENLPAFEKARNAVASELTILLNEFEANIAAPNKGRLLQITDKLNPESPILPTLALPVTMMATEKTSFYGLLSDRVTSTGVELSRTEIQMCAKALSEKSKMEILLSLKDTCMFNLKIAETIGLTPATVSHHMNSLLVAGFVDLEKRNGKVYYRLAPEGIRRFTKSVEQMFL